jgi:hypothetical protein
VAPPKKPGKPGKKPGAPKASAKKPAKKSAAKSAQKSVHKSAHKPAQKGKAAGKKPYDPKAPRAKAKPGDKRKRKGAARGKARKPSKALTAAQRSVRDTLMLTRRIQGWDWPEIMAEAGIKRKQTAEELVKAKRESMPKLLDRDEVEIIENLILELQVSIGDFEKIANAALAGNNLNVAVGAKARADDSREKLRELLQSVGALPHDLGTMTHIIDIRAIVVEINSVVEGFVDVVRALPLPDDQRGLVIEAAEKVAGRLDDIASSPQSVRSTTDEGDEEMGDPKDRLDEREGAGEQPPNPEDRLDERVEELPAPPPLRERPEDEDEPPKAA